MKFMKNKKQKRKEYYVHQIVREESNFNSQNDTETIIPIVNNNKKTPSYAESVGYHIPPSRYDVFRKKTKEPIKEVVEEENPKTKVEVVEPSRKENNNQESMEDDYYSQMADQYQEINETVVTNVISEKELSEEVLKQEKLNNKTPIVKPAIKTSPTFVEKPQAKENEVTTPTIKKRRHKYVKPSLDLLIKGSGTSEGDEAFAKEKQQRIDQILQKFGIHAHVAKYIFGPTVIEFLVEYDSLDDDVKSIRKAEQNLAMYLACSNIRLLTPVPGMCYAGIELPRPKESRGTVYLGDMLADKRFAKLDMKLPVAVGRNNFGDNIYIDIYDMPHGLCAGATKSGKSVCLNAFIMSLIYRLSPDDVRLILIDPKFVEFGKYSQIPHLAVPVITEQELFEPVVCWLTDEMERRYKILQKNDCVELAELNNVLTERGEQKIPFIVMIMDEFNDWFMDASSTVDNCITKLMQKARAAGIHIILATQRPSADVIKGAIKANITTRLAFRVSSFADSNVVLGQSSAEKLEGRGDMILRHNGQEDMRLQGAFVSNKEIKEVVQFLRDNNEVDYIVTTEELQQSSVSRGSGNGSEEPNIGRNDELFEEVAHYVVVNQNASVNQMQRIHGTGFNRMDAIFKDMEKLGIISPAIQGARRKVLINEAELEQILNEKVR